jgi:inorganic pyrophosphatase
MDYKKFIYNHLGNKISPWHDIKYKPDKTYNFVNEIPKLTKKKMEISKDIDKNPLVQDLNKKGELREYNKPIYWNYGFIPQTWCSTERVYHEIMNYKGDGDALDLVEIGEKKLDYLEICEVKILGCLALIDEGEVDFKIICINKNDINYDKYNEISDVPSYILSGIREWFRWYKYPDNLYVNKFGYGGDYLDSNFTKKIIKESHNDWKSKYS